MHARPGPEARQLRAGCRTARGWVRDAASLRHQRHRGTTRTGDLRGSCGRDEPLRLSGLEPPLLREGRGRIYYESARQSGEASGIRFVTNSACQIEVANVTFDSIDDDDSFSSEIQELQRQGYRSTSRLYMVFLDKDVPGCGIGNIFDDSRPGPVNTGNFGPRYGRADLGCWGGASPRTSSCTTWAASNSMRRTARGSTASTATTAGTSTTACARTTAGPTSTMAARCRPSVGATGFDCNDDDYYSTGVPTGYLSNHWNTANSGFLHNNGFSTTNGDFNGDGMDDIACFERASSGERLRLAFDRHRFRAEDAVARRVVLRVRDPAVGDFNGDGRDDIASFTRRRAGDVVVAVSNGSSFAGPRCAGATASRSTTRSRRSAM